MPKHSTLWLTADTESHFSDVCYSDVECHYISLIKLSCFYLAFHPVDLS